jgi:hypothetical protein
LCSVLKQQTKKKSWKSLSEEPRVRGADGSTNHTSTHFHLGRASSTTLKATDATGLLIQTSSSHGKLQKARYSLSYTLLLILVPIFLKRILHEFSILYRCY